MNCSVFQKIIKERAKNSTFLIKERAKTTEKLIKYRANKKKRRNETLN